MVQNEAEGFSLAIIRDTHHIRKLWSSKPLEVTATLYRFKQVSRPQRSLWHVWHVTILMNGLNTGSQVQRSHLKCVRQVELDRKKDLQGSFLWFTIISSHLVCMSQSKCSLLLVVSAVTSDVTARLGWLVARLRHWSLSKWLLAALSCSEPAKLTEIARSCGQAIPVVFIPYLCILAIKYDE